MGKIAKKLTDLVGNTPLLELSNYNASKGLKARVVHTGETDRKAGIFQSGRKCERPYFSGHD